jgi:hypothetical protein
LAVARIFLIEKYTAFLADTSAPSKHFTEFSGQMFNSVSSALPLSPSVDEEN